MGRLTEIIEAVTHLAADLNRELFAHIDLTKHNEEIKEARKQIKKARKVKS